MDPTKSYWTVKWGSKQLGQSPARLIRMIKRLGLPMYRISHIQIFEACHADRIRQAFKDKVIRRGRPKKGAKPIKVRPSRSVTLTN